MATLEVLWSKSKRSKTKLPVLIDIASSYDGFDRNPGLMMFSACILAALGYPTLLHGVEKVGPKYGLTTHKLLNYFGKNPLKSMSYTLEDLEDPSVGWGYVDQSVYFPELFALQELRHDMVKRPVISTIEKLLQPIQTKNGNHLITGYTHPGYKTMLSTILKEQKASPISLLVRGLEGSAQLPLDRQAPILTITKNDIADNFIRPSDFDIPEIGYNTDLKFNEEFCMNEGLKALDNNTGPIRNMIIYNTASILFKFGLMDKKQILNSINTVLKNKSALDCFDNF
jgi:anthranilate phosphoribosyltransferase